MIRRPDREGGTRAPEGEDELDLSGNGRGDDPFADFVSEAREPGPRKLGVDEILRLWLMATLVVLIGGAVGYVASFLVQEQYGARSEVLYSLSEDQPTGFLREDRNLTTQTLLVESRTVLGPVARDNGLSTEQLAGKVSASVAEGSEIIDIEVRDPDPEVALGIVDELMARYLTVANTAAAESRTYLESQIAALESRLDRAALTGDGAGVLTARRSDLLAQLDALALAGPQARLLGASYVTADPVSPRRYLSAGAGALAALLIAAALVALLARRWTRQ